jgi:hypothetical protein
MQPHSPMKSFFIIAVALFALFVTWTQVADRYRVDHRTTQEKQEALEDWCADGLRKANPYMDREVYMLGFKMCMTGHIR